MRTRFGTLSAAIFLAATLVALPTDAATASITIDHVNGRTVRDGEVRGALKGRTLVTGEAVPASAATTAPAAKPLVADAGDSGFVNAGGIVTLLGSGFGGSEPYSFAWTTSAGTLDGADAATAQVNTAGVAAGTHTATLTVTDRSGATATDTVKFVVYEASERELSRESRQDTGPGVLGAGSPGHLDFPVNVPANTKKITVKVTWTLGANDYDMRVLDPSGKEATSSGKAPPVTEEVASVENPVAGTWKVVVDKYATVADTVTVVVTGIVAPADPRPAVKAGGPYRFALGAAQPIAGTVTGGTAPVSAGWDTDQDGRVDRTGTSFSGAFAEGRHLVTLKATGADGLERRETTSVLVARPERLATDTTAVTVVAINDSGINPYHLEFSTQTYPDPEVLALTDNFQKHPSQYLKGYPADAQAIRMTIGQGYHPAADKTLWKLKDATNPNGLEFGKMYWIPGTKIVGATQPGPLACSNCATGASVILDDDGHGSGSASVSVGNRYGYCGSCLLVVVKGLSNGHRAASGLEWIDIQSNSWGTVANAPLDLGFQLAGTDPGKPGREAVERGQTVLFAAGNGTANAFESVSPTYGTSTTGPDWNVVVGAIRRDNQRAIVGEGTPAHLSAWGDGNLPSACRTGTVSQCAFGGTSAATPYTAGVFGTVLTAVRRHLGDSANGPRAGQVIAEGFPIAASPYLKDGRLTRAELREAVLKTAFPLNQDNAQSLPIYPYPLTAPYNGEVNVLFEGYGAATPNSAKRAIDVLLGRMPLPVRAAEDRFFEIDRQIRDSLWGGYDRDGNGTKDEYAPAGAFGLAEADVASAEATWASMRKVAQALEVPLTLSGSNSVAYYFHRRYEAEPGTTESCASNVTWMDQEDTSGDRELCYDSRITTVLAAYRPVGMWPSAQDSAIAVPAGSTVNVELYVSVETPTAVRPTAVLMAGDREIGTGSALPMPVQAAGPGGALCASLGEACWTKFGWSFKTTKNAIAGEQLTIQVSLLGTRSWAFGYEGMHASRVTIVPAAATEGALDFGATTTEPGANAQRTEDPFTAFGEFAFPDTGTSEAGAHPQNKRVYVSVDDPTFAKAIEANLTFDSTGRRGTWSAPIPAQQPGKHTLYVRAEIDRTQSPVSERSWTTLDTKTSPRVQWQVTQAGVSPADDKWAAANGVLDYYFMFDTRTYGTGDFVIHSRLVEGGGVTASTSVRARFR